jgi:anaerobic glycerol-3-phosphate dehydrogenase
MANEQNKMEVKSLDLQEVVQEIGKFTRKVDKLSKAVDYVTVELMPQVFGNKINDVYRQTRKSLDYIMRHLI